MSDDGALCDSIVVFAASQYDAHRFFRSNSSEEAGAPVALFDAHMKHDQFNNNSEYDVTADGKRFLINAIISDAASLPPLTVVVNWNAESKK
jgi:hypothetical protein